jgi:hypothetical protein
MVRIISLVAILASCISSVLALANGIYTISNGVDYWTETLEDVIYLTTATGSDNQEVNGSAHPPIGCMVNMFSSGM